MLIEKYLLEIQQNVMFKEFDYNYYKTNFKQLDKQTFDAIYNSQTFKKHLIKAIVVLIENKPAGFYILKNKDNNSKICNIHILLVDPKYRNRGVGQQLIANSIETAKTLGFTNIELTVHKDNDVAIHLYKKNGFVTYDKIKDRFVLRKKI